jgi:hypothetical protein
MAYKNKEKELQYYREYYYRVKKPKYIAHPIVKRTKEEKLAIKRAWNLANKDKVSEMNRRKRVKNLEKYREASREYARTHKDELREYHKKYAQTYYLNNKAELDKNNAQWVKDNPDRVKVIQSRYKENNPEKIKATQRTYNLKIEGGYRMLVARAKKKNYQCDLSLEYFRELSEKPCAYCGESKLRRGIDRVDNKKGYTKDNSVPCCKLCNFMKKALAVEDFLLHIKKINKHSNYTQRHRN